MKTELTDEQAKYAVARFVSLFESRDEKQTHIAARSGLSQPYISKIIDGDVRTPSRETLERLFDALGLKLSHILNEDHLSEEIVGYLATPLTALTTKEDSELRRIVKLIRDVASDKEFVKPSFRVYWPGDHTHPKDHIDLRAHQVYLTDRSRASTNDFIILFCGAPSYGVGQENEIATQAGIPAIRLIPPTMSRMMLGSFIHAEDIMYSGTLQTKVALDADQLREKLRNIREAYFRYRALYRTLNGEGFGRRLRSLIETRCNGDFLRFSNDIGVSLFYLHKLMDEPFAVSNPSVRLLKRIAHRLGERVAFLLDEVAEDDPVWVQSHASWRAWIERTSSTIDAAVALRIRDEWRDQYAMSRRDQPSVASFRDLIILMDETKWDKLYQKSVRKATTDARQGNLL